MKELRMWVLAWILRNTCNSQRLDEYAQLYMWVCVCSKCIYPTRIEWTENNLAEAIKGCSSTIDPRRDLSKMCNICGSAHALQRSFASSRILAEILFHELITFSLFPSAHFNIPYGFILMLILYCMKSSGKDRAKKAPAHFIDSYYVYYIDWASVPAKVGKHPTEHQSDS